jgi:hypothetical protein
MAVDWSRYLPGDGSLSHAGSSADYETALRLIAAGDVLIKVRSPPYHSIKGARSYTRTVGLLIWAGLAEHEPMIARQTHAVQLTALGKQVMAQLARTGQPTLLTSTAATDVCLTVYTDPFLLQIEQSDVGVLAGVTLSLDSRRILIDLLTTSLALTQ